MNGAWRLLQPHLNLRLPRRIHIRPRLLCVSTTRPRAFMRPFKTSSRLRKTFRFVTGMSAKPKSKDIPIVPQAVEPYISVQVGEDSFFIRHDAMGYFSCSCRVADGVGGWSEVKGANPALYSLKLMHYSKAQLDQYDEIVDDDLNVRFELETYGSVNPKHILAKSFEFTNEDAKRENIIGSTTAMIIVLRVFRSVFILGRRDQDREYRRLRGHVDPGGRGHLPQRRTTTFI